jgi:hypothetical protein
MTNTGDQYMRTVTQVIADPQFQLGANDYRRGLAPREYFNGEPVEWAYERGRAMMAFANGLGESMPPLVLRGKVQDSAVRLLSRAIREQAII